MRLPSMLAQTTPKKMDLSWKIDSYSNLETSEEEENENKIIEKGNLEALNTVLSVKGHEPLTRTLQIPWADATTKTKHFYTSKVAEVVSTVLEIVAPSDAELLWNSLKNCQAMKNRYSEQSCSDTSLSRALVESYKQTTHCNTRTQILSVLTEKLSFRELENLIPGLSTYKFTEARRHGLHYGVGAAAPKPAKAIRERVDPSQIEHFIEFITSQHVIQDLPFGRRKLKMSTGEQIDIPNVIRILIPSRLVNQYLRFCQEQGFSPLAQSTLMKILSDSCAASVRKCMKGLDNYLAEGAQSFDDLKLVVEKLEQTGLDRERAVSYKESLLEGKSYLKGDYKVRL